MKKTYLFIVLLFLSLFHIQAFSLNRIVELHVDIINNTNDEYLYQSNPDLQIGDGTLIEAQNAVYQFTTKDAIILEGGKPQAEYSRKRPHGIFTYMNRKDSSICTFQFNGTTASVVQNNGHCSVSEITSEDANGLPYRENAVITIS